jgi:hypothetical protein
MSLHREEAVGGSAGRSSLWATVATGGGVGMSSPWPTSSDGGRAGRNSKPDAAGTARGEELPGNAERPLSGSPPIASPPTPSSTIRLFAQPLRSGGGDDEWSRRSPGNGENG